MKSCKKIVFFNYYHNGDIHVSRGFIRQIINKVHQLEPETQFFYGHRNYSGLLADIPNLSFDANALSIIHNDHINMYKVGDTTYINTWYNQQNSKYMGRYSISIDTLYAAFNDTCKNLWGFSLNDISTDPSIFFPVIDYDKLEITQAKNWLDKHPAPKVFVSNGIPLSDQAHIFPLTEIIISLSNQHRDKIFILSNKYKRYAYNILPNIFYSSDIINKKTNDLNENSFISSHCDVIIGSASGAFTFSMTQENLFHRNNKFLAFCNLVPIPPNKFWVNELLRDKINYKSKIIVSNESDTTRIYKAIHANL